MNSDFNFMSSFENVTSSAVPVPSSNFGSARKFVVFEEEDGQEENCSEASNISTLTFLNFVLASISVAASVSSNTNSNANSNNDNNNNNNLNNNNINLGNNNNNINSENMLTFQPMVGKRKRRYVGEKFDLLEKYDGEPKWIYKIVVDALELFAGLQSCNKRNYGLLVNEQRTKNIKLCIERIMSEENRRLERITIEEHMKFARKLTCEAFHISLNDNQLKSTDYCQMI